MKSNRSLQLTETLEKLNKSYGNGSIQTLSNVPTIRNNVVSTGIPSLDVALGVGGIYKGNIVEIYGTESSGKTTLALHLCKQFQKKKEPVLYIDAERTLTKETIESIGISNENFYVMNFDTIEDTFEACITSAPAFGLIVIDSIAALQAKAEKKGNVGDSCVGLFARIMSETLPKIVSTLADNNCTLIIINQIREKVGVMFGSPEKTMGGRALKYYAAVRMDIRRVESLRQFGNNIGNLVRVKIIKNKIAAPFKEAEFNIIFGEGISCADNPLESTTQKNIIRKDGSYYIQNDK